jgi:hypothetical protein
MDMKTFQEALKKVNAMPPEIFMANCNASIAERFETELFVKLLSESQAHGLDTAMKELATSGNPNRVQAAFLSGYAMIFEIGLLVGMEMEKQDL